jgi:hypothetical protein
MLVLLRGSVVGDGDGDCEEVIGIQNWILRASCFSLVDRKMIVGRRQEKKESGLRKE